MTRVLDLMQTTSPLATIEEALEDMRAGKMVIVVDDRHRENEGDLVVAAEHATPEVINFMITHARGLVCMPVAKEIATQLALPPMVADNQATHGTAFTTSIGAKTGITTGISPFDRAQTIKVAIDPASTREDIVMPGHVFPLVAEEAGVLKRPGHTEAVVDLARLAGCRPAGVICEIINGDGTMARLPDLMRFAPRHTINIITIADLILYREGHG